MGTVAYATREDVKRATDFAETARSNAQVDRAIRSSTRAVEGLLKRRFYPQIATRFFDWPNRSYARPWRLWLDADEVVEVSQLTAGGVVIASSDYFLEPANSGPPYNRIEIDLSSNAAFAAGPTRQRAITVTGLFAGCDIVEEAIGELDDTLAADITDSASITWTTAGFGVGDILRVDDERLIVTERTMVDSTQSLQAALTAAKNDVTVSVTDGTAFSVDEVLLLDSERMLVVDIAGNLLTVRRAWDGSTLATHSGSDIFTLTGVEVDRGQLGTTLAAHTTGAVVYRFVVPDLVRDLCIAEAINRLQQETSAYGREVGEGENAREASGRGLRQIRMDAVAAHGRKMRARAV